MNNGYVNYNNKTNTNRVRPVAAVPASVASPATPEAVYGISFSSVVEAWIDCERNKKKSNSCVKFRWHAQRDLYELWQQMRQGAYKPRASMAFIVRHPVQREIWAGAMRDRTAHHWEALRFGPLVEKGIAQNGDNSMNCRKGYGSLRAVATFERMIWEYTDRYRRQDCWIVGGDFANYFMSIDKSLLWGLLESLVDEQYEGADKDALLYMMRATLMHRCQESYFIRGSLSDWEGLPAKKSLFHMDGLPIGNLPSQLWANFLGSFFMRHVMKEMGIKEFILFVDDWRMLVRSAEEGRRLLAELRRWLKENLRVTLHPNKTYLQHYTKGTKMVGAVVKPRRVYITNRTRGHFIDAMRRMNQKAHGASRGEKIGMLEHLRASINSYLGLMIHYSTYKIRKRICEELILPEWGEFIYFVDGYAKCMLKRRYDQRRLLPLRLRSAKFARKFLRPKWSEE